MADEQDKWLDRDAAERLLRGEPLEAVDADTQGRAKRLADVLGALAPEPAPTSAELPGEAAALAAFQQARASRNGEVSLLGRRVRPGAAAHSGDAGLVRLGRPAPAPRGPRWGRPVRLGIVAALAAGMIGGVAVAAGTGVLPTPFRDDSPHPAATISAAQTPRQPFLSPSPGASKADGAKTPVPGATTSAPAGAGSGGDEAQGPGAPSGQPDSSDAGRSARAREWWAKTRSYCRDVLGGKTLESGRRRVLVDAAGGGRRVTKYCKGVLGRTGADSGEDRGDQGSDSGSDQGAGGGSGDGSGSGSGGGDNGGDGDGHTGSGGTGGHHGHNGILAPSPRPVVEPLLPTPTS
ncbi:hypothetical protein [Streptomyces olivochromogenes]|uniref:Uncharacterized protein n=1 Tax=Streptomyces olivochromogenes TaxID=1963 RepID=A0A250VNL3_STROL|nr:hypothetical protein [Streptomyces olivochromogenes]KUN47059.1 hypothetical protein AQJ27_12760 [Streptomyces olivochromogenes]GAX55666.1 hypothetical protein SO3561_07227 [Streptomyces olivochromogenes]